MATLKFSQHGEIGEKHPKEFKIYLNGKSKVKTGCVTCKIRRIKCDEAKPACKRCSSTGRKCDGYSAVAPKRSKTVRRSPKSPTKAMSKFLAAISQSKVSYQPSEFPDCTLQERRSLDFFVSWSAHCMKPWPGEEFWKVHVPSSAYSEPSIRHAMIAIANTHEEMREIREALPSSGPAPPIKFARRKTAVEHYHKSISELSKVIAQRGTGSEVVALLNSALFFCFDFMWGNVAMALLHYQSGAEIFEKWKEKNSQGKDFGQGSVETNLATLFNMKGTIDSKDCHAWESEEKFRPLSGTLSDQEGAIPRTAFISLDLARRSIHHLMWEVQALIFIQVMRRRDPKNVELSYLVKQEEASCRTNLKTWSQNFETYPESLERSLTVDEEEAMDTIRLMYLSALIWLWAGVNDEEDPLGLFAEHLKTAYQVYKHLSRHGPGHFTRVCVSDSRIWPAYAIIATRCDDPDLTRRAREMLVRSNLGPRDKMEEHWEESRKVHTCLQEAKDEYFGYEYYSSKRSQGAASGNGTLFGAMVGRNCQKIVKV